MKHNSERRKKMKKLLGLTVLALGVVLAGAPNVMADNTFCPPAPGAAVDNLVVDGECFLLEDTNVEGNVEVLPGGSLTASGVSVTGNVEVLPGGKLDLILDSIVGGNIECKGALGCVVIETIVGGNLKGEESTVVLFFGNNVVGNVEAEGNLFVFVAIGGNTIGGNLECDVPADFGYNVISGNDECPDPV